MEIIHFNSIVCTELCKIQGYLNFTSEKKVTLIGRYVETKLIPVKNFYLTIFEDLEKNNITVKIPEKIYGRTFKFSSCWESGTISTPSKEQLIDNATGEAFDIQTFLKEYVDYYNGVLRTKVTRVRNAKIIQEV